MPFVTHLVSTGYKGVKIGYKTLNILHIYALLKGRKNSVFLFFIGTTFYYFNYFHYLCSDIEPME